MQAWQKFLLHQEKILGKKTVDRWLHSLKIVKFDACNLYLETNDSFQVRWFEEHIRPQLKNFVNNNGNPIKVHLNNLGKSKEKSPEKPPPKNFSISPDSLNANMTLDNYIPSDSDLAYPLIVELSKNYYSNNQSDQPYTFNPFFIHGNKGSGKTHLLQGCAHALIQRGLKVFYVHAQRFTNHVVDAIRQSQMQLFREAYRHIDILIIENIEIFSRKNATQEEFFHTFNTLHGKGSQIIISSLYPPNQLQEIEPRLISRFEWGITLPLSSPTIEHRKKILLQKAKMLNIDLKKDVVAFLIDTFSSSSSLIQALEALTLRLQRSPTGIAEATGVLNDLLDNEKKQALTPEKIIHTVAATYGIRAEDILGKMQTKECSLPRQLSMYLCRKFLSLPYLKIGTIFSRDHSTVMTNVKYIQKKIEQKDINILSSCIQLTKKLESLKDRQS